MERELWSAMYLLARKLDNRWGNWRYSTADVLAVYFWAVVHDRPTSWAANPQQWPDDLQPALLPPQNMLSRRLRQPATVELMTLVEQHLVTLLVLGGYLVQRIDGSDPVESYRAIRRELEQYGHGLADRPEVLAVSKAELPDAAAVQTRLAESTGHDVLLFSSVTGQGLDRLLQQAHSLLQDVRDGD